MRVRGWATSRRASITAHHTWHARLYRICFHIECALAGGLQSRHRILCLQIRPRVYGPKHIPVPFHGSNDQLYVLHVLPLLHHMDHAIPRPSCGAKPGPLHLFGGGQWFSLHRGQTQGSALDTTGLLNPKLSLQTPDSKPGPLNPTPGHCRSICPSTRMLYTLISSTATSHWCCNPARRRCSTSNKSRASCA
jgi:hypothetical protein